MLFMLSHDRLNLNQRVPSNIIYQHPEFPHLPYVFWKHIIDVASALGRVIPIRSISRSLRCWTTQLMRRG